MIELDRRREAILRFVALRDGRDFENALTEYRGQAGNNNGLYAAVEATVHFLSADDMVSASHPDSKFQQELSSLLNRYSKENASDTPDFVLAEYLVHCLKAFDYAVRYRESTKSA
jgi:hypothetical protein